MKCTVNTAKPQYEEKAPWLCLISRMFLNHAVHGGMEKSCFVRGAHLTLAHSVMLVGSSKRLDCPRIEQGKQTADVNARKKQETKHYTTPL